MDTETKLKYISYTRKSTESEDRQILSLDDQEKELKVIEKRNNLNIVQRFAGTSNGESQSAHKRGRPIFNFIMGQIDKGKANALLVWHPNRLARNAYDGGLIITLMDENKLIEVKTAHRTYSNTPEDKFMLQLEFGMAKKSSDDNSVAVKRGLKTKLEMGWYPSRAPLGYLNSITKEKGSNEIIKDPERFELIKRMWQMMITGNYTPPQILQIANKEWNLKTRPTKKYAGLKSLSRSAIYKIFTNPFYYGFFEYHNNLYKGNHEPMITEEEFDRVQKFLGRRGNPRAITKRFAFTGLMKCGNCGAMITAEEKTKRQKNGNVHHYVYYRCTKRKDEHCPEKAIRLDELNNQINQIINALTISDEFRNWAIKYLHEIRKTQAKANEKGIENKQKELTRIIKQLDSLLLKYTAPENSDGNLISSDEYQALKTRLIKQKLALESDLTDQGKQINEWVELSERTFNFARYASIHFNNGDMETKRAIFACLGSHLIIKNQKLSIDLHPMFETIFENKNKAETEIIKVITSKISDNIGQFMEFLVNCPSLRRRKDSNLREDFSPNILAGCCFKPLSHASTLIEFRKY